MLSLYDLHIIPSRQVLADLRYGKLLINTINAHSYNVAQKDVSFAEALQPSGDTPSALAISPAVDDWLGAYTFAGKHAVLGIA